MHENITIGMPHGYFGSTIRTQLISIASWRRALIIFSIKVQEVKYISYCGRPCDYTYHMGTVEIVIGGEKNCLFRITGRFHNVDGFSTAQEISSYNTNDTDDDNPAEEEDLLLWNTILPTLLLWSMPHSTQIIMEKKSLYE